MKKSELHIAILICCLWLIYSIISIIYFEKIPLHAGFGYDGVNYAAITKGLPEILYNKTLSSYYLERSLPPAIVRVFLEIMHADISDSNIVYGFCFLNGCCIMFCILFLYNICMSLQRKNIFLFGSLLMLLNFPLLKNIFFEPVSTDYLALLFGFMLLYYSLSNKISGLFIITLLSLFCWPMGFYTGSLLIAFSHFKIRSTGDEPPLNRTIIFICYLLMLAACLVYGIFFMRTDPNTKYPINISLLWISASFTAVYLWCISRLPIPLHLLHIVKDRRCVLKIALLAGVFLILTIGIKMCSDTGIYSVTPWSVIVISFLRSVERPFIFIIGHLSWFGPLVFCLLINIKKLQKSFPDLPVGLRLVLIVNLLLGRNSETRFLTMGLPFFLYWILQTEAIKITRNRLIWFACLGFLTSKVWLLLTPGKTEASWLQTSYTYYLNFGPMMRNDYYIIQLIFWVAIFTGYFLFSRVRKESEI